MTTRCSSLKRKKGKKLSGNPAHLSVKFLLRNSIERCEKLGGFLHIAVDVIDGFLKGIDDCVVILPAVVVKLLHSNAGDKCKRLPDNLLPRGHHVHTAIGLLGDIGRCGNVCVISVAERRRLRNRMLMETSWLSRGMGHLPAAGRPACIKVRAGYRLGTGSRSGLWASARSRSECRSV